MLYLAIAKDAQDPDALKRRQRVRPQHLTAIEPHVKAGRVKLAGALLNDAGDPIGSALIIEAESITEAKALLREDIYTRERVWTSFEVHPFKQAF